MKRLVITCVLCCLPFLIPEVKAENISQKDIAQAKATVRASLKDPDSAKFGKFISVGKNGACLAVNARNSLGGYTGNQQAYLKRNAADEKWTVLDIQDVSPEFCKETLLRVLEKTPSQGNTGGESKGNEIDENLRRYLIAVNNHIQEHWVLPDSQKWDKNLEAIIIIRVRSDGEVTESSFKKRSDNVLFDHFIEKILKLSAPFPPFPIGINKSEMEIGLRFRPEKII